MFAYFVDFDLDIENIYQTLLAIFNPIPTALLLLGLPLYFKNKKVFYTLEWIIFIALSLWVFANSVYFREFSDFMTLNTIKGSSKVSAGLGEAAINLFKPWDLIYIIDIPILAFLFKKKVITMDPRPFRKKASFAITSLSVLLFSINLFLAEVDRPELLTRGFSNTYIVRYLGLQPFIVNDSINTYKINQVRNVATPEDLSTVENYVQKHYAEPDPKYYGIAKGRNVIYIHLESFQQFLIDYKLKDEKGVDHEVTPFLNSLFHSKETFAFDNFFHQVKAGKTSDAETLMENSFFGLTQGSLFVQNGGKNTFKAAPSILDQKGGYTSAVFHGNAGTFWNRNETYKHLGYDYFFDQSYYDVNKDNSFQYGLHDKYFFNQSIEYLEHIQQPFYAKFITVSNHYPYTQFKNDDEGFPIAKTDDDTINGYFATANYLDQAVKEFFDYLKATGVYQNSMIVLYGDHYGISNSRNPDLAPLLGKQKETWSSYDNAMLQRVPYMIVLPGQDKGYVNHTFGGEVDNLPTMLHLLGIDSSKFLQLGQDMLSPKHDNLVAFRNNGNYVAKDYTVYNDRIYRTDTGEEITNPTPETKALVDSYNEKTEEQLNISDKLTRGDLLRFYDKDGLKPVDPDSYTYNHGYKKATQIEKELGDKSTSIYSKNNNTSTVDKFKNFSYKDLHPELKKDEENSSGSSSSSSSEQPK
ncbi:LTA synthase family protein [Floricoccus penangensis]|nr:LTA synthase family protein [Floricoccus penangensis]URZ88505.1 LTA synthase family protein [Floricoccus penangensis]